MEFHHVSVLLEKTIKLLNCQLGEVMVDGTLGGGGHAHEILKRITPGGYLIGIDRDLEALRASMERLKEYREAFVPVHNNYINIKSILAQMDISGIDGMVMDLGVSSYQLDEGMRGFSYQDDAPLDMRMDTTQSFSANEVINNYSEKELIRVIRDYGEERWASRIARFIVDNRPLDTTGQLVDIIKAAIPAAARRKGPHPAKRTFQAVRIEVNQELSLLKEAIQNAVQVLNPGGRLCIITFHSLEDRIVKHTFQQLQNPCTCPPKSPVCICGMKPIIQILTRKPVMPDEDEILNNPRSRSAKLRACQKL